MSEINLRPHPQQEIKLDEYGVVRFRRNQIVSTLLDTGKLNMNDLHVMNFSQEDRIQFAQLIGYSVSGFGELSYVPQELAGSCDAQAANILKARL